VFEIERASGSASDLVPFAMSRGNVLRVS